MECYLPNEMKCKVEVKVDYVFQCPVKYFKIKAQKNPTESKAKSSGIQRKMCTKSFEEKLEAWICLRFCFQSTNLKRRCSHLAERNENNKIQKSHF